MNRVQTTVTESELQRALDCGELIRLYQPVIDLAIGCTRPGRGAAALGSSRPRAARTG